MEIKDEIMITVYPTEIKLTPQIASVKPPKEWLTVLMNWNENKDGASNTVWTKVTLKDFKDVVTGESIPIEDAGQKVEFAGKASGATAADVKFRDPNLDRDPKYCGFTIELEDAKGTVWKIDPVIIIKPWFDVQ